MARIDLYILRLIVGPLAVTLLVTVILFLLDQMLRLFDYVLVKSGPVELVWRMLSQLLPQYLSHGISLGLFIGILLAFRRMSQSGELAALAAGGISLRQLLRPVYALAIAAMAANFVIIAYLQPLGLYRYQELRYEAAAEAIKARVKVGRFLALAENVTLRVAGLSGAGETLEGIFIERCEGDGHCVVASAARGAIAFINDEKAVHVDLHDGQLVETTPEGARAVTFDRHTFRFDLPELARFRDRGADQREATLDELVKRLRRDGAESVRQKDLAQIHWRILHTLTFLAIPLVALAFGLARPRVADHGGPILGLAVLIGYNKVLEAAQRWVVADTVSPWLTMWPLFVMFLAFGVVRVVSLSERPPAAIDALSRLRALAGASMRIARAGS